MTSDQQRDALIDFANAIEAACVQLRMRLGDTVKQNPAQLSPKTPDIVINEVNFTQLKWEPHEGPKMGLFDIASKADNDPTKFDQAYNVLKACNADIKNRYHGKTYEFSYWLYEENNMYSREIFRQKLKEKT